jgi:dimethylamine monooxygenase subunit A
VWMDSRLSRLPGILPLGPTDWLRIDEAYGGQMAEREQLIATRGDAVHALLPRARDAALELLDAVEVLLPDLGFRPVPDGWHCPDGRRVAVDRDQPLLTLGRLVQEDLCILQPGADGHVLTGAILCFPASWTLSEKLGRALPGIHRPVEGYEGSLATRVQRLFDAIRPEQPLWRGNALAYADPALFQPRRENERRSVAGRQDYIRSERQCLLRLPRTRAVVFTIHTYVVRRATLNADEETAFAVLHEGGDHA